MDPFTFGVYCLAILGIVTIALIAKPQVAIAAFKFFAQLKDDVKKHDEEDATEHDPK